MRARSRRSSTPRARPRWPRAPAGDRIGTGATHRKARIADPWQDSRLQTTTMTHLTARQLDDLRATISGRIIEPGDADYDEARTVMYGGIDKRPRAIVRVANDADVQAVVDLAREAG